MTLRTPNVFVFGGGAVAAALAGAWRRAGVPVLGLWARRPDAARNAAALSGVASFTGPLPTLVSEADVLVLAVRDEAIQEVATRLGEGDLCRPGQVALHCAGALAAHKALAPLAGKLGGLGTLHPLRAFTDARRASIALPETTFAIEGDERAVAQAERLVLQIGSRALRLSAEQLPAYHAAAVIASNGLVALVDAAGSILERLGLTREAALVALLPLVSGTIENLSQNGLLGALTGPVVRGDAAVVAQNLEALAKAVPPLRAEADLYRMVSRRLVGLARERGTSAEALARLAQQIEKQLT